MTDFERIVDTRVELEAKLASMRYQESEYENVLTE